MAEYIEREPILRFIEDGLNNPDKLKAFGHDAIEIMTEVQYAPAADVAPVVHGRWVNSHDAPVAFSKHDSRCPVESCYCSECHEWLTASDEYYCLGNYCPNCGAKMDAEA